MAYENVDPCDPSPSWPKGGAMSSLAQLVKQFEKSKPAEPAVKRSWKEIRHEAYKKKTKFGLALS